MSDTIVKNTIRGLDIVDDKFLYLPNMSERVLCDGMTILPLNCVSYSPSKTKGYVTYNFSSIGYVHFLLDSEKENVFHIQGEDWSLEDCAYIKGKEKEFSLKEVLDVIEGSTEGIQRIQREFMDFLQLRQKDFTPKNKDGLVPREKIHILEPLLNSRFNRSYDFLSHSSQ